MTGREILPDIDGRSLRLRLLLTVVIALTPAAAVSIVQGLDRVERDAGDVHDRMVQTARATAADEQTIFASAQQILRAMANQPEVSGGTPACAKSLANALSGAAYFTNLARLDAQGHVLCSAVAPAPEQADAAGHLWWAEAQRKTDFFLTPQFFSLTSRRNILAGILPLHNESGAFTGAMALALDVSWLDHALSRKQVSRDAVVGIFDSGGTLIASNNLAVASRIFVNHPKLAGDSTNLLSGTDAQGNSWSYTLGGLLENNAYIAYAMRNRDLFAATRLHVATDLLLPVLMLGFASAAIWIATDRQVTRWIVYLRRIATAYARGHYAIRPVALEEAPSEFRMLGETFSSMAAAVQDRDRRLREAVAQKTLLIKETHHRVKNNLQIVMSLLSLQAGRLRDEGAQTALRQAQVRVNALALVHRILHEIEDLGSVDLKILLQDLVHQIVEGFGADRRDLRLELDIASRQTTGDLAVPVTLFAVEALTNAFKHAFPGTAGGTIRLSLLPVDGANLRLAIEDNGTGVSVDNGGNGIGSRLIQAFAQQVGGSASVNPRPGGGTVVALTFPDPLFEPQQTEILPI